MHVISHTIKTLEGSLGYCLDVGHASCCLEKARRSEALDGMTLPAKYIGSLFHTTEACQKAESNLPQGPPYGSKHVVRHFVYISVTLDCLICLLTRRIP